MERSRSVTRKVHKMDPRIGQVYSRIDSQRRGNNKEDKHRSRRESDKVSRQNKERVGKRGTKRVQKRNG